MRRDIRERRDIVWPCRREENQPSPSNEYRERAAGEREDDALGHELPKETSARRAERVSYRELPLSCRAACEEQVRDIRARDEKQQRHRGRQHQQRLTNREVTSGLREVKLRDDRGLPRATHPRQSGWIADMLVLKDRVQLFGRRLCRYAR